MTDRKSVMIFRNVLLVFKCKSVPKIERESIASDTIRCLICNGKGGQTYILYPSGENQYSQCNVCNGSGEVTWSMVAGHPIFDRHFAREFNGHY